MQGRVQIGPIQIGSGCPLALIAGPCVIESAELATEVAGYVKQVAFSLGMPYIFKASYDKANRTSLDSFRGPGIEEGLAVLGRIREAYHLPVLSDVHNSQEAERAAGVLDVMQVPAFLCRQTDLLTAVARTGRVVNVKKGQFMAPWDMTHVVAKLTAAGGRGVLLTERGTMHGYNNLVVDFRSIAIMKETGCPVVFDATHSVQLPGGAGSRSGGQRRFAPMLARAAVAAGADAVFMEVHPDPDRALCDAPNTLPLVELRPLLKELQRIRAACTRGRDKEGVASGDPH
jgi:2-dehydro-3-deoxyphosphooctonate aldolase (KDO 8-P synthase)